MGESVYPGASPATPDNEERDSGLALTLSVDQHGPRARRGESIAGSSPALSSTCSAINEEISGTQAGERVQCSHHHSHDHRACFARFGRSLDAINCDKNVIAELSRHFSAFAYFHNIEVELFIMSMYEENSSASCEPSLPASTTQIGTLSLTRKKRVVEFIEKNLGNHIELPDIARAAALSPTHFCRAFRRTFGVSPVRYVWRRRIEAAKLNLRAHTLSLTMIALTCGFSSASHFSTAFRYATGVTPTAYARSMTEVKRADLREQTDA